MFTQIPLAFTKSYRTDVDWDYNTMSESVALLQDEDADHRTLIQPSKKSWWQRDILGKGKAPGRNQVSLPLTHANFTMELTGLIQHAQCVHLPPLFFRRYIQSSLLFETSLDLQGFYPTSCIADYDNWAAQGAKGWSYADLEPSVS